MSDGTEDDAGDQALGPGEESEEIGGEGTDEAGEDEAADEAFDGFSGGEPGDEFVLADGASGEVGTDVGGFDDADDGEDHPGGVGEADGEEEAGEDAEVDDGHEGGAGGGHGAFDTLMAAVEAEGGDEGGGEDGGDEVVRFDGAEPEGEGLELGVGGEFGDLFEPGPEHAEEGGEADDGEGDANVLLGEEGTHFEDAQGDDEGAGEGKDEAGRGALEGGGPAVGEVGIEEDERDEERGEEEAEDDAVLEHTSLQGVLVQEGTTARKAMVPILRDDFGEGVGDEAGGAGAFEFGDELAFLFFFDDDFDGDPEAVGEGGDGGGFFGGEELEDGVEGVFGGVEFEADFFAGVDGALEKEGDVLDFFFLDGIIGPDFFIGDETGGGGHEGVDDAEVVGADGGAGFGDVDDGVEEAGFDFGGAPGEFDFDLDVFGLEVFAGDADEFGGDDAAVELFGLGDGGFIGDAEDPLGGAGGGLGVDEFEDFVDVGAVFLDPVMAGETDIDDAVFDVAGHFLGAEHDDFDGGVVDGGEVGAVIDGDFVAGFGEEIDGGILEGAFGDSESEDVGGRFEHCEPVVRGRKKGTKRRWGSLVESDTLEHERAILESRRGGVGARREWEYNWGMDDQNTYLLNGLLTRGFALGRIVRFREMARGRQAATYEVMTAQQNEYVVYLYPPTHEVGRLEAMATALGRFVENRFTVASMVRAKGGEFVAEGPQGTRMMVSEVVNGSAVPAEQMREHDVSQVGLRLAWMHRLLAEQLLRVKEDENGGLVEQLEGALERRLADAPVPVLPSFPAAHVSRLRELLLLPSMEGWVHGEITAAALLHDADRQLRTVTDWALLHWGNPLEDVVDAFLSLCSNGKGGVDEGQARALLESYDSLRTVRRTPWTPAVGRWLAQRMIDASYGRRPLPKGFGKWLASPEELATGIASHGPG